MTARAAAAGIGVLLLLAMIGVGAVVLLRGVSSPVLLGLFIGAGLGAVNLVLESFLLAWALKHRPSWAQGVSLGGFGLRAVLVVVLTFVFDGMPSVDAMTFALTYAASFFAFLIVLVGVVSRMSRPRRTGAAGESGAPSSVPPSGEGS